MAYVDEKFELVKPFWFYCDTFHFRLIIFNTYELLLQEVLDFHDKVIYF
jgi:hypothetical protein